MLHQDHELKALNDRSSSLLEVVQWVLQEIVFSKKLHVNCSWTFSSLTTTALFWSWSFERTMTERISCAQRLTRHLQGSKVPTTSRQGFMEIVGRHTAYLKRQLLTSFRLHMSSLSSHWKTFGFVIFGVDGSEVSTPRTRSNQVAFTTDGKSKHQKRSRIKNQNAHQKKLKECPRILMTTLYHIALGLPWSWRVGSKNDNERGHLLSMREELPSNALIVGDAGFTGFDFLSTILTDGYNLVIRVGSNVKLLKQLGRCRVRNNIVHVWPKWAMKREHPPLMFRLVVVNGKQPVHLITSVLDSKRLSDDAIARIYSMRWGIELYHRDLKQTMGRHKLLNRSSQNCKVELEWAILGYAAMMLYSVDELIYQAIDIQRMSPAKIIRAFQHSARDYLHPKNSDISLNDMICLALKDDYQRTKSKQSRDYPQQRKHTHPKPPIIQKANGVQNAIFKSLPA